MRLFIGINFDEDIKNELFGYIAKLKNLSVKGTFTLRDNIHLSLVFIGETHRKKAVIDAMEEILAEKFTIVINGQGCFRGSTHWIGVEKNPSLERLYRILVKNLIGRGFSIDSRPYVPHITMARRLVPKGDVELSVKKKNVLVKQISLMKSERINGELVYTEIYKKEL